MTVRRRSARPARVGRSVTIGSLCLPIDHVAFATADLDAARAALVELGLSYTAIGEATWPAPDGPSHARTTSVVLSDGYLDVIETVETPAAADASGEVDGGPGSILTPTGVILGCDDVERARRALVASGVRCGRPYPIDRRFGGDAPDQHYEIFGTAERHGSGLPLAVIRTRSGPPMQNESEHANGVRRLEEAANLFGLEV